MKTADCPIRGNWSQLGGDSSCSIRPAYKLTMARGSVEELLVSSTKGGRANPKTGVRFEHGRGVQAVDSTISKRILPSMQSMLASRAFRAMAKPHSSPWHSIKDSRWYWSAPPGKGEQRSCVVTLGRQWRA